MPHPRCWRRIRRIACVSGWVLGGFVISGYVTSIRKVGRRSTELWQQDPPATRREMVPDTLSSASHDSFPAGATELARTVRLGCRRDLQSGFVGHPVPFPSRCGNWITSLF